MEYRNATPADFETAFAWIEQLWSYRTYDRARDCRALILDSGLSRVAAHQFYEHIGFEKSCYGFEKPL
nr:hypothetical protein [uncultured Agathobaculum sp.]